MKLLLLLLALAAGTATAARAQTEPATDASGVPLINKNLPAPGTPAPAPPARRAPLPPNQQASRQSQRLTQALGLSADQQAKVQQILLGEYQNLAAARQQAQASGTRRGMGRARQANRAQVDEQLRQVLTPDQYARYQQLLTQRRQQAQQRRQQRPGGSLLDD